MKMTPGSGTIADYGSYINNCQARQMPFKVPINTLADVQLYIAIGASKPDTVLYQLIHTCGPTAGTVDTLSTSNYVVGQDTNGAWYGVFKNLISTSATCFVIAITLTTGGTDQIFFSEEYCIEDACTPLTQVKGCYGNLNNLISYDCEGVYFGTALGASIGDATLVYKHELLLRNVEVSLGAIKNTFKQGRTRTFRTEKEKIYNFMAEFIPEWYLPEIDAVFYRGEVYVGTTRYLVNETQFEKIEDCKRMWQPNATFKASCFQSFSCEADPCAPPAVACCDPEFVSVDVSEVPFESGFPTDSGTGGGVFGIVVIHSLVDGVPNVTGTYEAVTGIVNGSFVVTCNAFEGHRVFVERGNLQIPGIDPGDGGAFYTKVISDNFITFSTALMAGEFIYIETI